jgi:carbon-monoxide dehydrogenase catalytic subunit
MISQNVIVGFSAKSLMPRGSLKSFVNAIRHDINGIVIFVGCSTHAIQSIAKELIKRDILLLSVGCTNFMVQLSRLTSSDVAGYKLKTVCRRFNILPCLCFGTSFGDLVLFITKFADELNVDTSELPIAVSAYPTYKSVIEPMVSVALGLFTHIYLSPETALTKANREIEVDGKLYLEVDTRKIVDSIVSHITQKRKQLGFE